MGHKLKFLAPVMSSVGNVQLSVEKLELPLPLTFLTHNATNHKSLTL